MSNLDGDLKISHDITAEVKYRKDGKGFTQLERWMQECDVLMVKRARQDPYVCMEWDTFIKLMRAYHGQHIDTASARSGPAEE